MSVATRARKGKAHNDTYHSQYDNVSKGHLDPPSRKPERKTHEPHNEGNHPSDETLPNYHVDGPL